MSIATSMTSDEIHAEMERLGQGAREAAAELATTPTAVKDAALLAAATAIRTHQADILQANTTDMDAAAHRGLTGALVDRLKLDDQRVEAMAAGLEDIAGLQDPVGTVIAEWTRPNGLRISRVRVPLGVIGVIYESRPNVTADAAALCLKSGNAVILRGGSESFHSSMAIMASFHHGLHQVGLPKTCAQLVPTRDRAAVGEMLIMTDYIDIIVPRGGKSLIKRVIDESRIPVIKHMEGICHVYVDGAADLDMARKVVVNAKMRRPGICGAAETLLVDAKVAESHLGPIIGDLITAGCEVRGDAGTQGIDSRVTAATPKDWDTEYLDAIISVKIVDGVDGAISHIGHHSSHHTESIITDDEATAERFLGEIDSAIVLHNASTQFADGGEFGMGAEIGISTDKLHARGPVGVEQLTSYKYVVRGSGQVRP